MSGPAIRVEGLGKRYELPGRTSFWALRDVAFDAQPGEVVGIIGRNGAGKSTLLKILAGIVAPSAGRAELIGRVGSLLELGTGFHPDLSGRENLVLAAALLGVPSAELRRQFDRIVDYSGVGEFIDVPVKRYSSGMYMRLGYAVTSLLESEILLLDEVLAVGDAEFERKTKQNVDAIAHDGRIVLFVSHSMGAVRNVCSRCIWIDRGAIVADGPAADVSDAYLATLMAGHAATAQMDFESGDAGIDLSRHEGYYGVERRAPIIRHVQTARGNHDPAREFRTGETLRIRITIERGGVPVDYVAASFHTMDDVRVTTVSTRGLKDAAADTVECVIDDLRLISGEYAVVVECGTIADGRPVPVDSVADATHIRVRLDNYLGYPGVLRKQGALAQPSMWQDVRDGEAGR